MRRALLPTLLKFAGVGAIATAVQYALLVLGVEVIGVSAVLGSSAGFVIGAVLNYWLNYHFTFRSDRPHWAAAGRFAVTAAVGLGLNALLMALLVHRTAIPYVPCQVITTAVVLGWNFVVNSLWSFAAGDEPALPKGSK